MRETNKHQPSTTIANPSSFVSLLSGWIQQGMESFFATQRILMEVATRQNTNTMKTMRDSLADPKHSPIAILKELVVEGTSNFIEAQRILLDFAQRENEIVLNGVKERLGDSAPATAMTDMVRRGIDTFVDMQQEFLTIANRQAQQWIHEPKKFAERTPMLDLAQESMDNFVKAQKKFLDVIAEETENASKGKGTHTTKAAKRTELTKLANESVKAMMDAQKKLLDLASQQMNVNLQMASRASEMATPFRLPIAKLTGDGVRSFVDAEKALIDTMMKRGQPHTTNGKAKRTVKRAAPKRKVAVAHAGA